jgi:opacity protein-like surface antigen
MIVRVGMLAVALIVGAASVGSAQPKEPLPRVVADLRAASAGLTTGLGWTPAVPQGTLLPGRGLGFDVGGHVYVATLPFGALGVGSTFLMARGTAAPPGPTSSTPAVTALPEVQTRLASIVPQVSVNFGHRLGWSYISGGLGRTRVRSEVAEPLAGTVIAPAESSWVRTLNYGAGARWFINDHVAFTVDLRWFKVSAVEATSTRGALSKQSLITASAGIAFK